LLNKAPIKFESDGSFKALGQTFRRVTEGKPLPKQWNDLLGSYGPEFIPLIVSERNGHLYAMTENMYDYRLMPVTETVFKMPPGLYTDEYLVFHRSEKAGVHTAVLANMPLMRRKR
jgi:cellobiose phosphorylase